MKRPSVEEIILNHICPKCGKQNCSYANNNKDYKKMCEAYLRGDMATANKIMNRRFSQYLGMVSPVMQATLEAAKLTKWIGKPNSLDLYRHYRNKSGETLELADIGLSSTVRPLVNEIDAFGRNDGTSIESRFIDQFKSGQRTRFSNTYKFGDESENSLDPLWAIGSAKIEGEIKDIEFRPGEQAVVNIDYKIYDKFTDPYDTFNWVEGEHNPDGRPYIIKDKWQHRANFSHKGISQQQLLDYLKR